MSGDPRRATVRFSRGALAGVALALGCAGGMVDRAPDRVPTRAPADPSTRAIELEVIRLTNEYRRAYELPIVREDAALAELARGHSRDMARAGGSIDHDGVRGRFRVAAAALPLSKFAENVGKVFHHPEIPAAPRVLSGWGDSAAHRKNLQGPFALVGVGVVRGPGGSIYFTQILAAVRADEPRSVPASIAR
jgi:uncharacterized protein YkwD